MADDLSKNTCVEATVLVVSCLSDDPFTKEGSLAIDRRSTTRAKSNTLCFIRQGPLVLSCMGRLSPSLRSGFTP